MGDKYKQRGIIALIALIVAFAAAYVSKEKGSAIEKAAEAVLNIELGLPAGTVDINKDAN